MTAPPANKRKRWLLTLLLVFVVAGLLVGWYWFGYGQHHESTDDAYVVGNLIRVTPRINGTVVAVLADDTDLVKQGQVLVELDDTDARIALDKSEADLGQTVRHIGQAFGVRNQQSANLAAKRRHLEQTEADLARRQHAVASQAISREEVEHARADRDRASAEFAEATAQLSASEAIVAGTTIETHPEVKQAEARLRESWLALLRCKIHAPDNGQVAKRSVQVGQQVAPGVPLMTIIPTAQIWVEANFKEDQLKNTEANQPVRLISDLYGSGIVFHGVVAGLSPGTGSVFSLLPPQNASGNWIKIVQRLAVRIALDPRELRAHPLRVGLSMKVVIDTSATGSNVLQPPAALGHATIPVEDAKGADSIIRSILKANRLREDGTGGGAE